MQSTSQDPSADAQVAPEDDFPRSIDESLDLRHLKGSEKKTLDGVTTAWFQVQPIHGRGGARRFQPADITNTSFTALCSGIVEDGWTVGKPVPRPTLYPATFKDKALVVGTLKSDLGVCPETGVRLEKGSDIWALPKVNDRRDNIILLFKTKEGIAIQSEHVKLMPLFEQRPRLWDHVLFHHDQCEYRRITDYNLSLAIAIFRERLRESAKENRKLSDVEMSRRVPAKGFEAMKLATVVFDARVLRNTLSKHTPPTLPPDMARVLAAEQSANASRRSNGNGQGAANQTANHQP